MKIKGLQIEYFPDEQTVNNCIQTGEPLLMLVKFDYSELLISELDAAVDHIILLRKLDKPENDIDKYFRIVLDNTGADWTFVCPQDYKNIPDKQKRIERFYNDGIDLISAALNKIGLPDIPINIPKRYGRHWEMLKNEL